MLTELELHDFRRLRHLCFRPGADWTFVTGANALGKTSLLEAICVLLRLQSQRTHGLPNLVREGSEGFGVEGEFAGRRMHFFYSKNRRKLVLDGQEQSKTTDYLAVARVVYFGNADLDLIRGSAEQRRRFLDFLAAQVEPSYRSVLRQYERALRSRNFLLKQGRGGSDELRAFDGPLVKHGDFLTAVRRRLVTELQAPCREAQAGIGCRTENLELRYRPGAGTDFAAALRESEREEQRLRQTVCGPHRDDVEFLLDGRSAARFGSEGQQRTLALALRLGQSRVLRQSGRLPLVMLLDDVFGELDRSRRNRLMTMIPSEGQRIVTSTTLDWMDEPVAGDYYELRPSGELVKESGAPSSGDHG